MSELKFDGVEIIGFRPHPHPDDYASNSHRQDLRALISGLGLGISGYAPDFTAHSLIRSDDHAGYIKTFEKNLSFARDLEMPAMRVDSIDPPTVLSEVNLDAALKRVVPTWQRCAELAEKAGVLMVWEFEPGFAFNKPSEVLRVVNEVGHSNFKILFDTSHAHMSAVVAARHQGQPERLKGGVIEMIQMLKGKIGHIHLIDSDGTLHNDETSTHRPFGEGDAGFRRHHASAESEWLQFTVVGHRSLLLAGIVGSNTGMQAVHGPAEREVRRGSSGTGALSGTCRREMPDSALARMRRSGFRLSPE